MVQIASLPRVLGSRYASPGIGQINGLAVRPRICQCQKWRADSSNKRRSCGSLPSAQEFTAVKYSSWFGVLAGSLALSGIGSSAVRADELPAEFRQSVTKGLDWLVKMQQRDGHW